MPSKVSQKRSASPSPKARQHKRPRINLVNHASATSNSADNALNNTEASENSLSLNVLTKKSRRRSASPSTGARKEKCPRVRLTPSTATTCISADDASSKTEANTNPNPKIKLKLKITMNKNPEPSKMPAKITQKRSISPLAEAPQTKRVRAKSTPHKSITSEFIAHVSSNSKKTIETNPASTVNQVVIIRPRMPKSAVPDQTSQSEAAKKEEHVIQIRENNRKKPLNKSKPRTNTTRRNNQFVAINPPLPKPVTQEPLRSIEDAENNAVGTCVPLKNPGDELHKSVPLADGVVPPDKSLPVPLARDPLKRLGAAEKKFVALWMRANKTVGTRGKYLAFQNLLYSLGCKDPSFDKETLLKFDHRVERFISRIKKSLKECGAIAFREEDKFETYPVFADWTVVWLEEDWDGVYDTRGYYTDNYLEKYSSNLEGQDDDRDFVVELAVDEPFKDEVETFVVEVPEDFQIPNVTDADSDIFRNPKHYCNPYGMADWR